MLQEWDTLRSQRTDALDSILERLGEQVVPPDFHTTASPDVSPFGIPQDSDEEPDAGDAQPGTSPTDTLRNVPRHVNTGINGVRKDRSSWKTLRDFVDERAIEDMLDRVEGDRSALDVSESRMHCILWLNCVPRRCLRAPRITLNT